jgi:hypothetical protein
MKEARNALITLVVKHWKEVSWKSDGKMLKWILGKCAVRM